MNIYWEPSRAIGAARTIYRLRATATTRDALDRIVGTPTNPRPDGAARDPQVRRQYTMVSLLAVLAVKAEERCHSETCRKRFESIEKEKLDKQLEGHEECRTATGDRS